MTPTRADLRYPLAFVALVLSVSWAFTAFLFSAPQRVQLFPFIMFLPATCALIVSGLQHRSVRALARPVVARVDLRDLAASVLLPVVMIAACAGVAWATGLATFDAAKLGTLARHPPLIGFLLGVLAVFGEEYGWRGYLLPQLTRVWGPVRATVAVGVVWAVWHGPVLFGLARLMGTGDPVLVSLIQMGAVLTFAFPFAYVAVRTGSVFPPMLFHYVWNWFNPIVLGSLYRNQPGLFAGNILVINGEGVVGILVGLLFVAWFVRRYAGTRAGAGTSALIEAPPR